VASQRSDHDLDVLSFPTGDRRRSRRAGSQRIDERRVSAGLTGAATGQGGERDAERRIRSDCALEHRDRVGR
jgi:hypothetical protein